MKRKRTLSPLCACGCGNRVTWNLRKQKWNTYLSYHHTNGRIIPKEVRDKISNSLSRENHFNWKGGVIIHNGYVLIKMREHPFCDLNGYVKEERLVVEKIIGRYLLPNEVVHHKDRNRCNNLPNNLQLFSSKEEHDKFHNPKGGGLFRGYRHSEEAKQKMSLARKINPQPRNISGQFMAR